MNKKKAQKLHAQRRACERFGFIPNDQNIVHQIQTGKATFVRRQSHRVTVWRVDLLGKDALAVYDKHRKTIVTYLYAGDSNASV